MSKKKYTTEEAIAANGGRPLTDTFKFRHPNTGEIINDVKDWQDDHGNWLPTKFNEETKKHEPIPLAAPTVRKGEGGKGDVKESEAK